MKSRLRRQLNSHQLAKKLARRGVPGVNESNRLVRFSLLTYKLTLIEDGKRKLLSRMLLLMISTISMLMLMLMILFLRILLPPSYRHAEDETNYVHLKISHSHQYRATDVE